MYEPLRPYGHKRFMLVVGLEAASWGPENFYPLLASENLAACFKQRPATF